MTTYEEAKEIIIKERDSLKANPMVKVENCLYEAFDMAIKALEQEDVLDKIKAEIMHEVNNHKKRITLYDILQIINKYKTESEEEI